METNAALRFMVEGRERKISKLEGKSSSQSLRLASEPLRPELFGFGVGRHFHICSGYVSCPLLRPSQNILNCFSCVIVKNDRRESS